jgi:hypothetical protein
MRKALGAMRFPYGPCFGPEEEPGHDSPGRKASSPTNWEMIQIFFEGSFFTYFPFPSKIAQSFAE